MRSLVLVGLLVALAAAGCQPKKTEPTTQIYPPGSMNGPDPMDDFSAPPDTAVPEPIDSPAPSDQTSYASAQRTHVVVKGDTLWGIARKHYGPNAGRQDVQKIINANPGINPDRIFPGQKIIVP